MLSVAKLRAARRAYYEQAVAAGLDDYTRVGASRRAWCGSGAEALGLLGVVASWQRAAPTVADQGTRWTALSADSLAT